MRPLGVALLLIGGIAGVESLAADPRDDERAAVQRRDAPMLVLYAVTVNGQDVGTGALLQLSDGSLHARAADLQRWGVRRAEVPTLRRDGEAWRELRALPGARISVDAARQTLAIELAPSAFAPTRIDLAGHDVAPALVPGRGGFVNYDLVAARTRHDLGRSTQVAALVEGGAFGPAGTFTATLLGQDSPPRQVANGAQSRGRTRRVLRLETTWTHDDPGTARTLQVGDTIGPGGLWGRPIRYGGVRWGTNFATRPGFVTYPLPSITGETALPSTAELYVDGVLRRRDALPPGPFQLNDIPALSATGEVRLVVRDMLGREQILTEPYDTSSLLLRQGLSSHSVEFGFERRNFGLRDADYGRAFAAGTLRRGINDRLTTEARMELLREQQTVGVGASMVTPLSFLLTAAAAASRADGGSGHLTMFVIEHRGTYASFGLRSQWNSRSFAQLGQPIDGMPWRRETSAHVGWPLPGSTLGLSLFKRAGRGRKDGIGSLTYTLRLGSANSLVLSAIGASSAGSRSNLFGITLVSALDERITAAASRVAQGGALQTELQLHRNAQPGGDFGYRLLVSDGEFGKRNEVGASLHTERGNVAFEAGRQGRTETYRLSAQGGVALLGGYARLTPRLGDAFAIVEVPGHPGVGIHVHNQVVARTDAHGVAFVPRLLPYQRNPVRIDATELPLDAGIDATQLDAVPYSRSGVVLRFGVRRLHGALLALTLDDGGPVPAGALIGIIGAAEEFSVAQRGEAFVTGLDADNRLRLTWREQSCIVAVALPADAGPLPRLGPLRCSGVAR